MASLHERFGPRGVEIVGVHTPEFDAERDRTLLEANLKSLGVRYPVVVDNDGAMWDALDTRAWPTLTLIDKRGRIRLTHEGEVRPGDRAAREIESSIEALLAEASP